MSHRDSEYGFAPCHSEPPAHVRRDADGHDWQDPDYVEWWISVVDSDPLRALKSEAERGRMVELVRLHADERGWEAPRFIDLGCGWGSLGEALLTEFPESTFVGVDLSQAMLDQCRLRLKRFGDRVELVQTDLEEPFRLPSGRGENQAATAVFASRCLHHLPRRRLVELYVELGRQLVEGDYFLNLDRAVPARRAVLADLAAELGAGRWMLERWAPMWLRNASLPQQRSMLERAGFRVSITRHRPPHPKVHRPWLIQGILAPPASTVEPLEHQQ